MLKKFPPNITTLYFEGKPTKLQADDTLVIRKKEGLFSLLRGDSELSLMAPITRVGGYFLFEEHEGALSNDYTMFILFITAACGLCLEHVETDKKRDVFRLTENPFLPR